MRQQSRITPWVFAAVLIAALAAVAGFVSTASRAPVMSPAAVVATSQAEDGQLRFKAIDVDRKLPELGDQHYGASPQGSYTVVTLRVRNTADTIATFDGAYVVGLDAHGHRVTADRDATALVNDDAVGRLTRIPPGTTITTKVAFDVEPGHRLVQAEVHDSVFSRGSTLQLPNRVG